MTSTDARVRTVVLSGTRIRQGPYGIDLLPRLGYRLRQVDEPTGRLGVKVRDVIDHRTGYPVCRTLRSLRHLRSADMALAFFEKEALTLLRLKRVLPARALPPVVVIVCWLADELERMPEEQARACAAPYADADLLIVFSANQVDVLSRYGINPDRVAVIPFGFATGLFACREVWRGNDEQARVVTIGVDRGRDYETLMAAASRLQVPIDFYGTPQRAANLVLPPSVTYRGMIPFDEYRQVLRDADVVAVPTHLMAYPSGQTVAIEAAATGAAVILTRTPALEEYFTDDDVCFVDVGDVEGWAQALEGLTRDAARREHLGRSAARRVRERFTYEHTWQAFDAAVRSAGIVSG